MWWSFQKVPIQSLRGDPMPFGGFYLLAISHAASSVSLVQYKLKKLICGMAFAPPEWHCTQPALDLNQRARHCLICLPLRCLSGITWG